MKGQLIFDERRPRLFYQEDLQICTAGFAIRISCFFYETRLFIIYTFKKRLNFPIDFLTRHVSLAV